MTLRKNKCTRAISRAAVAGMIAIAFMGAEAGAQSQAPAPPSGQKTLAATMNVYVFPTKGQKAEQQSQEEAECYGWATQSVGTDPFEASKQAQQAKQQAEKQKQQTAQATQGAGAKSAIGGAAAGALIGEIVSDDAGKGAAYGAAAGLIRGRRKAASAQSQANQKAATQTKQAEATAEEQIVNFKKAFSVCLEAKNYLVKY